jgi:hypothetical protein
MSIRYLGCGAFLSWDRLRWQLEPVEQLPDVAAIEGAIRVIRGQRVMLDADLASLYGVATRRLNEQVRRNSARFPPDFVFEVTSTEWKVMLSQFATTLQRTRRSDRLPLAFTEHGCLMASNMLRSARAVEVSVLVVRAFVRMRTALAANVELAFKVDGSPEWSTDTAASWPARRGLQAGRRLNSRTDATRDRVHSQLARDAN